MEEVGIGRPSTYASTISTLKKRKYVVEEKGILTVTDQGKKTAHVLEKYFPDIVDAKYTADMENKLDSISEGGEKSNKILSEFYNEFIKEIDHAYQIMYVDEVVYTGDICPKCGSPLVYKEGKNGKFIGCSNYPSCNYVQKEPKKELVFTSWTNGGEHEDDTYDEVKAHVLVETTDPDEILRWLDAAYRNKNVTDDIRLKEIMKNILGQIEEIFKDWLDIERWMLD